MMNIHLYMCIGVLWSVQAIVTIDKKNGLVACTTTLNHSTQAISVHSDDAKETPTPRAISFAGGYDAWGIYEIETDPRRMRMMIIDEDDDVLLCTH